MIPIKLDKATAYSVLRWAAKWVIVVAAVLYVVADLSAKERAAEARLQRIEMRVDSLDAETAVGAQIYLDGQGDPYIGALHPWRTPLRDSTQRTPDTLLSIGPITVVRRN